MLETLIDWVNTNSYSTHLQGINKMRELLKKAFLPLNGLIEEIPLPPYRQMTLNGLLEERLVGDCLRIKKRETAPYQVLLGGHMDTVYSETSPFQKATWIDQNTLKGPGVTDMKGGLFIMLQALLNFEKHPLAKNIGWEVFINTDEEIGSPASRSYFEKAAHRFNCGLLFEPAFHDGAIAGKRNGSLTLYAIAKGKSAHAGRDFEKGINAITKLSSFILKIEALTDLKKGLTVNVGHIQGGGPLNVVPDFAICGINIRMEDGLNELQETLKTLAEEEMGAITLYEHSSRPPKPLNALFKTLEEVSTTLKDPIVIRNTRGTCDGNLLSSFGLINIDALGPVGGDIHTENEYLKVDSIPKRIERATALLITLAKGVS